MSGEFSVALFYRSGLHEYAERWVSAEAAVTAALLDHHAHGRTGLLVRVIIVDGGDATIFEWRFGQGVTFPQQDAADAAG